MKKILLFILFVTVTSTVFAQFTVHVRFAGNPAAPWVWAWDEQNGETNYSGGIWPGVELTDGPDFRGYYTFTFPAEVDLATSKIIINDGDGLLTHEISVSNEEWYTVDLDEFYDGRVTYVTGLSLCELGLKCYDSLTSLKSNIDLVIDNKVVKVVGASSVKIINISGITVQSSVVEGLEFVSEPLNSGMYIIVADGKATKVIIK